MIIVWNNKFLVNCDVYRTELAKPIDFPNWPVEKQQAWEPEILTQLIPRVIMVRERSKYKPHQGKRECARRRSKS